MAIYPAVTIGGGGQFKGPATVGVLGQVLGVTDVAAKQTGWITAGVDVAADYEWSGNHAFLSAVESLQYNFGLSGNEFRLREVTPGSANFGVFDGGTANHAPFVTDDIQGPGTSLLQINNGSGGITLQYNAAGKLLVDPNGVTAQDDLLPGTDSAFDFGSSSKMWRKAFVDEIQTPLINNAGSSVEVDCDSPFIWRNSTGPIVEVDFYGTDRSGKFRLNGNAFQWLGDGANHAVVQSLGNAVTSSKFQATTANGATTYFGLWATGVAGEMVCAGSVEATRARVWLGEMYWEGDTNHRLKTDAWSSHDGSAWYSGFRQSAAGGVVKQGFFGGVPVVKQTAGALTSGFAAGSGSNVNDDSTFTGNVGASAYTIGDIVAALKAYNLLTT